MSKLRAAFDRGGKPTIDLINLSSDKTYSKPSYLKALQQYINSYFSPVWGTPCKLRFAQQFTPTSWAILLIDTPDIENALGYHYVTSFGLPLSKVFVETSKSIGEDPSITISHELSEMLVDPAINLWANNPDGTLWAYETADAVEATSFKVNGFPMSNFVYPSFFEGFRKPKSSKFDHLDAVTRPFSLARGGYTLVWDHAGIYQEFGSDAKRKSFLKEDRRGHRSEYRQGPKAVLSTEGHPPF